MATTQPAPTGSKAVVDRHRFICELEFVQCMANPDYLHWLAKERYFQDARFIAYLKYLRYWKQPEYVLYLVYPQGLTIIDYCLESKEFRENLKDPQAILSLKKQQAYSWIYMDRKPADFEPFSV
eukprot:Protomagalhaensia_wolfi_Nauph_80__3340@NODE_33_length_4594_cov_158_586169_g26_i0_p4_GENE_NODE_33_length_4594_cov_158_586169_g26_i0NODE_33_length_4594_cov_158_586169_g26_i0_p4_ORF_typecomplete_len124_score19_20Med31/PF05669_12/1_1e31_NODE_33_length_4594_cov_158_586169_g26_i06701041